MPHLHSVVYKWDIVAEYLVRIMLQAIILICIYLEGERCKDGRTSIAYSDRVLIWPHKQTQEYNIVLPPRPTSAARSD